MSMLSVILQVIHDAPVNVPTAAPVKEVSMSYLDLVTKGGWLMLPIALLSVAAVYIFVERYIAIKRAARIDNNFIDRIRDYIHEGKIDAAVNLCQSTNNPVARMIEKGINKINRPMKDIQDAIEVVGRFEVYNLERNLTILGVIAGIAPMFGFIGTIAGVIKIFYNISLADNISIGLIAGGLYEKMVTDGRSVGWYYCLYWLSLVEHNGNKGCSQVGIQCNKFY